MNPTKKLRKYYTILKTHDTWIPSFTKIAQTKKVFCISLDKLFTVFICKETASGKKRSYHTFVLDHYSGKTYRLGYELPLKSSRIQLHNFVQHMDDTNFYKVTQK